MIFFQISFSHAQLLVGVLGLIFTIVVPYWAYRRSKHEKEIRWRTENVYNDALEETNPVVDGEELPGKTRNRQRASFWDDITYVDEARLNSNFVRKANRYYGLLGELEEAEQNFTPLNGRIKQELPDEFVKIEGTRVQLLAGSTGEFEVIESYGENPPQPLGLTQWVGIRDVFKDQGKDLPDVDSPGSLREHMIPQEGLDEYPYPDSPTQFAGGFRPEHLSFWEREFPEWDESLYNIVKKEYVREYLEAYNREHEAQQEVRAAAREIQDTMTEDISELDIAN